MINYLQHVKLYKSVIGIHSMYHRQWWGVKNQLGFLLFDPNCFHLHQIFVSFFPTSIWVTSNGTCVLLISHSCLPYGNHTRLYRKKMYSHWKLLFIVDGLLMMGKCVKLVFPLGTINFQSTASDVKLLLYDWSKSKYSRLLSIFCGINPQNFALFNR